MPSYPERCRVGTLCGCHPGVVLASAHRELSVALAQSQGYVYHSCALLLAKASGRQVLPGADAPFLD
jgi:hypothetical protein